MTDQEYSLIFAAMSELGAALSQSVPEDDQIIMTHVKVAHTILETIWREAKRSAA